MIPLTKERWNGPAVEVRSYLYPDGPIIGIGKYDESGTLVRNTSITYGQEGEALTRSGDLESSSTTFDAAYHQRSLADGLGHATTYGYDLAGRPTQIQYPTGTKTLFTSYDAANNLLSRIDGNGQVTNYAYQDGDGLQSSVSYPGAESNNISRSYDVYDRESLVTDGSGTTRCGYDDDDNLIAETTSYTGLPAQAFTYAYWPDGSRKTMVNPAGTWSYAYDADGRYASMTSPAGASSATYYDNGWQASRTLPNGATTSYAYDAAGVQTNVETRAPGGAVLAGYGASRFDGVFNLTSQQSYVAFAPSQGTVTSYAYDSKDRLTSDSSGTYSASHAYDAAGNPTTLRGVAQTFDADSRQSGAGFAYDGNGSPTTYEGSTLTFDPENRLASFGPATGAGYRADGLGAWKQDGPNRTCFLYDRGEPTAEVSSAGAIAGALSTELGPILSGCIAGGVSSVVASLLEAVCDNRCPTCGPVPSWPCRIAGMFAGAAGGCAGAAIGTGSKPPYEPWLTNTVSTVFGQVFGDAGSATCTLAGF